MEMGRYLGHTYNIPLYKIPEQGKVPRARPGRPSFVGNHELYALPCTPESEALHNPDLQAHFAGRIIEHLKRAGAPGDHLARLGLD
jgi:hypothetical protein